MTPVEADPRFAKYRNKGLLIDANLLLLYLVGELEPAFVPKFKRTRNFRTEDYFLLKPIIDFFSITVTIPGVLTEVSNLAGHLDGPRHAHFFSRSAERIHLLKEEHIPSVEVAKTSLFHRLGLTDAALILACKDRYLALSADFALVSFMENNAMDVINFNHLRFQNWN